MDRPKLRPVPSRPPGPVSRADALAHVAGELPDLDAGAAATLALVDLAGLSRSEAEVDPDALARARTALRRALHPLPGSGWCSRAERLLSDRLDDALDDRGGRVLDAHLANCERCVEHDRRLAQAQAGLVARFVEVHGLAEPADPTAPPELRVVEDSPPVAPARAPAPAAAPKVSPVADAGGTIWIGAAGAAVALTILSILIVILGALGASVHF
jgi:hypothetical protein